MDGTNGTDGTDGIVGIEITGLTDDTVGTDVIIDGEGVGDVIPIRLIINHIAIIATMPRMMNIIIRITVLEVFCVLDSSIPILLVGS
jgi:hypothetical protein